MTITRSCMEQENTRRSLARFIAASYVFPDISKVSGINLVNPKDNENWLERVMPNQVLTKDLLRAYPSQDAREDAVPAN